MKLRPFKVLKDGKEDPQESMEYIDFVYEREFATAGAENIEEYNATRMLFRQHLKYFAYE